MGSGGVQGCLKAGCALLQFEAHLGQELVVVQRCREIGLNAGRCVRSCPHELRCDGLGYGVIHGSFNGVRRPLARTPRSEQRCDSVRGATAQQERDVAGARLVAGLDDGVGGGGNGFQGGELLLSHGVLH